MHSDTGDSGDIGGTSGAGDTGDKAAVGVPDKGGKVAVSTRRRPAHLDSKVGRMARLRQLTWSPPSRAVARTMLSLRRLIRAGCRPPRRWSWPAAATRSLCSCRFRSIGDAVSYGRSGAELSHRRRVRCATRQTFEDLGGTFMKFGQLVASSPGVFGEEVSDEFRACLDTGPDRGLPAHPKPDRGRSRNGAGGRLRRVRPGARRARLDRRGAPCTASRREGRRGQDSPAGGPPASCRRTSTCSNHFSS